MTSPYSTVLVPSSIARTSQNAHALVEARVGPTFIDSHY